MIVGGIRRAVSRWTAIAFVALVGPFGFGPAKLPARAQTPTQAPDDPHAKDRAAIQSAMHSFVKAFEARDAKALAQHWTSEGEYENAQGTQVKGQAALERAFATFFGQTPEVSVTLKPAAVRFFSKDAALEEGEVIVRRGSDDSVIDARYAALWTRDGAAWRLARLSESPAPEPSIEDLAWLIGQWKSAPGGQAEIGTTYSWAGNKRFIHVRFSMAEKDLSLAGDQIIGVDPATGTIRSWTFAADGGVGETDWHRDGDHWVLEVEGTLADGRSLTETNILRRVGPDSFTLQSIDRRLEDTELADLPPVKVTRVKDTASK